MATKKMKTKMKTKGKTSSTRASAQAKCPVKQLKAKKPSATVARGGKAAGKVASKVASKPMLKAPPAPKVVPEAKLPRQDSEVTQQGVTITLRGPDVKLREIPDTVCTGAAIESISGIVGTPCSFDAPTVITFAREDAAAAFAAKEFHSVDTDEQGYIVDGDSTHWDIAEVRAAESSGDGEAEAEAEEALPDSPQTTTA